MAKKKQVDVIVWEDRILRGAKLRDKKKKEAQLYINYYKSNQWSSIQTALREKSVTNLIFAHVKSQLPFLYFQNPKWFVNPAGPHRREFAKNATIAQTFLNYYARENLGITLKRQMRFCILDAFFWYGVAKTGYSADIEIPANYTKEYDRETNSETYVDDSGKIYTPDEVRTELTNEKFITRRRSPAAFIFDTEAESCFEDGRYIIEEINLSLDAVKADKKYTNTKALEASYELKPSLKTDGKRDMVDYDRDIQDEVARVILYEIYDLENDKIITLAKGKNGNMHEQALRYDRVPDGIDQHPYSFLVFNDVPDEMYPLSDIKVQKSPQDEYNKACSMESEHAKKFARKYGYLEGMIEEDELEKIKNPEDGTFFKVKELPLAKCIEPLEDATLDPAVTQMKSTSLFNFRESGGSTEQDRGVVERRKTAFEASKMTEATTVRKQDRRSLVEDFAASVGTKTLQSMQANLTQEDVVQIGVKGDESDWEKVTRENIKGQMNVTVEIGSMTPKLPELERQDFGIVLQAITQFPPEMIQTHVNFSALLKQMPRMFPSLENVEFINDDETIKSLQAQIAKQKQIEQMMQVAQMRGGYVEGGPNPGEMGGQ